MKKKVEAELISIAHRILQLKDTTTISQLKENARDVYEKLVVLDHLESQSKENQASSNQTNIVDNPTDISTEKEPLEVPEIPIQESIEAASENKPEIVIEEINAQITEDLFVPATESKNPISTPVYEKNDMQEIAGIPQNPITNETINRIEDKPKSINDQLKKGIQIGLNDRLAFIKHLFDGSSTDYNRVLSQLNTLHNKNEADQFIKNMIKPDYGDWDGKEEYEQRFMDLVLNKFEH